VLADERIDVAPSILLAADVYLQKTTPAAIAFAAYSKELQTTGAPAGNNETGSPPVFTDRGYAHVIVARRGMGRSGGEEAIILNDTDGRFQNDFDQFRATALAVRTARPSSPVSVSTLFATSLHISQSSTVSAFFV
jgi:hypothetical protein